MKTKKIIKVLNYLQKYCLSHLGSCSECIFYSEHYEQCLDRVPVEWKLFNIEHRLKDIERL